MDEDDMVVIIIGDNEGVEEFPRPIKTEPIDGADVDELIEVAKKHGQPISVKEEYFKIEKGYGEFYELNEEFLSASNLEELVTPKEECNSDNDQDYVQVKPEYVDCGSDKDYVPEDAYEEEYSSDSENEADVPRHRRTMIPPAQRKYVPEDAYEEEYRSDSENEADMPRHRRTMIPPAQRKSFVQDLMQEYPELRNNKKALVRALSEIMRNVKRPEPPQDFYYVTDIMFECRKCGGMSETIQAAGRHYQERHGPRYLVCFACGVDFRSTTNLYKHEKRCTAPDIVTVLKARALSLGRKGRGRPFIPKPEDIEIRQTIYHKKYPCSECPAVFTSKPNLEAHENLHKGVRPFVCQHCPNAYTSLARLKRHCKQQHSGAEYVCDYCGRVFKIKAALAVHLNTHAPLPKFACEECPRRYATKAALTHHVRGVHRQLPPPCPCPICPKSYPRMSLVRDHMKRAHGMSLMTRRMFFKALPRLTDEQLHQAKSILTSDQPTFL